MEKEPLNLTPRLLNRLFHAQPSRHHQTFLKKGREVLWGMKKEGKKGKSLVELEGKTGYKLLTLN